MPGDPEECRQQARDCLRIAQQPKSHEAREDYTALANTWMQLANMFESDNALIKGLCEASVPLNPQWQIKLMGLLASELR